LLDAAATGDLATLKIALQERTHLLNYMNDDDYTTVLHLACRGGHLEMVKWAVGQSGLMASLSNREGKTALFIATEQGCLEIARALLTVTTAAAVNIGTIYFTPLAVACRNGHKEVVRLLLAQPDIDVNKGNNTNPLSCACDSNDMEILELILASPGLDVNARLNKGGTTLHHTCQCNQQRALKRLLAVPDIDVNARTDLGFTPLLIALQQNRSTIAIELLRDSRVDPNVADNRGRTPLWLTASNEYTRPVMNILACSPRLVDATLVPEGQTFPAAYAAIVEQYNLDPENFRRAYAPKEDMMQREDSKAASAATSPSGHPASAILSRSASEPLPRSTRLRAKIEAGERTPTRFREDPSEDGDDGMDQGESEPEEELEDTSRRTPRGTKRTRREAGASKGDDDDYIDGDYAPFTKRVAGPAPVSLSPVAATPPETPATIPAAATAAATMSPVSSYPPLKTKNTLMKRPELAVKRASVYNGGRGIVRVKREQATEEDFAAAAAATASIPSTRRSLSQAQIRSVNAVKIKEEPVDDDEDLRPLTPPVSMALEMPTKHRRLSKSWSYPLLLASESTHLALKDTPVPVRPSLLTPPVTSASNDQLLDLLALAASSTSALTTPVCTPGGTPRYPEELEGLEGLY